jgi:small conductance mechanosensitive channel
MPKTFLFLKRCFRQLVLGVGIALFAFVFTVGISPTLAQQALPSDLNPATSIIRVGNLISALVVVDGYELFRVAMKIPIESDQKGKNISIKQRATLIENEIGGILDNQLYGGGFAKGFNPNTLDVVVYKREGQTQIFVSDYEQLQERAILIVTPEDAEYNGYSVYIWANKLAQIIKTALLRGYEQRQPTYLYQACSWSLSIILVSGLLSFAVFLLQKRLFKQKLILTGLRHELNLIHEIQIAETTEKQQSWQKKYNSNEYQRLVLKLLQVLIFSFAIWKITGLFPKTRFFSVWLSREPLFLLVIITLVGLAIRITVLVIDSFLNSLQSNYSSTPALSHRRELRFSTYSIVLKGVSKAVWITVGFIVCLDTLEIPVTPVVAGLGIVGLALSFGSQNLIRDVLHGIFILFEDQYAVGDYITVGETSGYVEYMNLRITQLRGKEGRLTTLPNGSITVIHNQTKDWARIDFTTIISYESDINIALELMKKVIEEMSNEPDWKNFIFTPVILMGVNNLTDLGVELVIWIKTKPNFQWAVAREFRRRLKYSFDQQGIKFGRFKQAILIPESHPNPRVRT